MSQIFRVLDADQSLVLDFNDAWFGKACSDIQYEIFLQDFQSFVTGDESSGWNKEIILEPTRYQGMHKAIGNHNSG